MSDENTSQKKRHDFLIQQRDKHLSQFMEINGKAVFAAVLPIFTVLLAVDDVQGKFEGGGLAFWLIVVFAVTGIALLFLGALMLSTFHTHAIRDIQNRLADTTAPTATGIKQSLLLTCLGVKAFFSGKTELNAGAVTPWFDVAEVAANQESKMQADSKQPDELVPEAPELTIRISDYEIIPHNPAANTLIFGGLAVMSLAAVAALVGSMWMVAPSTAAAGDSSIVIENCEATLPPANEPDAPAQSCDSASEVPTPAPVADADSQTKGDAP